MVKLEVEGLARLRRSLYRFFAACFLYPEEARLKALREVLEAVREDELSPFAFHSAWAQLRKVVGEGLSQAELEKRYVRLFSVAHGGPMCPPHESYYVVQPGRAAATTSVELEREYRRMGLAMSLETRTLPDHVSVELEAMAFLCGKEAEAWASRSLARASEVLETEHSFMRTHLGTWFPTFSRVLMRRGPGFYAAVAAAADAFIKHDLDLLGALRKEVATHA